MVETLRKRSVKVVGKLWNCSGKAMEKWSDICREVVERWWKCGEKQGGRVVGRGGWGVGGLGDADGSILCYSSNTPQSPLPSSEM